MYIAKYYIISLAGKLLFFEMFPKILYYIKSWILA